MDSLNKWQGGKVDLYVITGFCNGVNVTCTLLACYMVQIGSYLLKFKENLSLPSSRFFWDCLIFEGRTNRFPQTSVSNYHLCRVTSQKSEYLNVFFVHAIKVDTCCRPDAERDGTRAETRIGISAKRTSPFKSAGGVSSVDCWQPRCAHQR